MIFEELIERARGGDSLAYGQLWRTFTPPLVRYLCVKAGRRDAEDLASITWLEVVRGLRRFEGNEADFRAWIFTIARHRYLDQRRNERRRPRTVPQVGVDVDVDVADDADSTYREIEMADGTRRALDMIAKLSPEQADAVMLRVVADLDVNSVAQIMHKRPGTVRVLTHRGIRRLAEMFPDES